MIDAATKRLHHIRQWLPAETSVKYICLSSLLVVALSLRLYTLPEIGVPTDEAITLWFVTRLGFVELLVEMPQTQPHYPLYYLLLKAWLDIIGTAAPVYARLPSVVAGVGTVAVTYLVGAEIDTPYAGLLASAFVAVSPFFITLSQLVRMYALFVFFIGLSWWCFLRVLRLKTRSAVWAYAVTTVGMVFTHYFGLLFLGAQAVFLLWRAGLDVPRRVVGVMTAIGGPAALWVTYRIVWAVTSPRHANVIGIPRRTLQDWVRIALHPWLGQHLAMQLTNQQWRFLVPMLTVAAMLIASELWRRRRLPSPYVPLVAWIGVPTALLIAYTVIRTPVLRPRYIAGAALGGFVALGVLARASPRPLRVALVLLLIGGSVAGLPAGYRDTGTMGWTGALAHVDEHAAPEDAIVVSNQLPKSADYHLTKAGVDADLVTAPPPTAVSWDSAPGDVWLVWRHPPPEAWAETEADLEAVADSHGYRIADRHVENKVVIYHIVPSDRYT